MRKCSCEWRYGFDAHVFLSCLLILVNSLVVFLVGFSFSPVNIMNSQFTVLEMIESSPTLLYYQLLS